MIGTGIKNIEEMKTAGDIRNGYVHAALVGPGGDIRCLYFLGGWKKEDCNWIGRFVEIQEFDKRVEFPPIRVNVLRLANDLHGEVMQVIAPEDIPRVLAKIKEQLKL